MLRFHNLNTPVYDDLSYGGFTGLSAHDMAQYSDKQLDSPRIAPESKTSIGEPSKVPVAQIQTATPSTKSGVSLEFLYIWLLR